jgi:RNA polymerase sigma factor (sigma-70 family)
MREVRRGVALPDLDSLFHEGVAAGLPDRELLQRFVSRRDRSGELAFTALVARHGPMVLGVCRRILRDPNEADDAFQATFLVLARKAGSIRLGDSLGPWLYGVSVRVARRLQSVAARREVSLNGDGGIESIPDRRPGWLLQAERRMELDEVLGSLPCDFRAALRLCYLEGLTHDEAADRLGCPVGTVRSRLARGRAMLRRRLDSTGDRPPRRVPESSNRSGDSPAPPLLTPTLLLSTAQTAARLAAGHPLAGVAPTRVTEVAAGVIQLMSRTKFLTTAFIMAIGSLAAVCAWAAGQSGPNATEAAASGQASARQSQREIDRPPSHRLRGDFDGPAVKRLALRGRKQEDKPSKELPADFPAIVVETVPKLGDVDVDPATVKEIRVTFSKPMMDKSWSWTQGNVYSFPESTGPIHYLPDQRTCVMPVKLEPGTTYVIGINGGRFNNFKARDGQSSLPTTLAFRTRAK